MQLREAQQTASRVRRPAPAAVSDSAAAPEIKLTPRWKKLRFHPEQKRAWKHPARFKTIHAGRRSGKTELFGKRQPVLWLWDCLINPRPWHDPRWFIAAPTRQQVKDIYWVDLKAMVPAAWLGQISETELSITTWWGASIRLVGLDKPQRMEGPPWDGGTLDEYASCKKGLFDANIRPALADRMGGVNLIGVPDFTGPAQFEYLSFCERGQTKEDPEWADFSWNSGDVIDPAELESMRRSMDPILFEQETGGKFIKPGGLAFPTFDYATHVRDDLAAYDPSLPLCWCLDFNVNPMCSGVIQHRNGLVKVVHSFSLADSSTDSACTAFLEWLEANRIDAAGRLAYYGDATGHARDSTSGTTDWRIVANRLRHLSPACKVPTAPFRIKDTVNSVRAKLKNAAGQVSLYVNSQCRGLINDFQSALWPSDMEECHSLAWLRYFVQYQYPVLYDGGSNSGNVAAVKQPA